MLLTTIASVAVAWRGLDLMAAAALVRHKRSCVLPTGYLLWHYFTAIHQLVSQEALLRPLGIYGCRSWVRMCTKLLPSYVIFHWLEWLVLILPIADDIPVGSNRLNGSALYRLVLRTVHMILGLSTDYGFASCSSDASDKILVHILHTTSLPLFNCGWGRIIVSLWKYSLLCLNLMSLLLAPTDCPRVSCMGSSCVV